MRGPIWSNIGDTTLGVCLLTAAAALGALLAWLTGRP